MKRCLIINFFFVIIILLTSCKNADNNETGKASAAGYINTVTANSAESKIVETPTNSNNNTSAAQMPPKTKSFRTVTPVPASAKTTKPIPTTGRKVEGMKERGIKAPDLELADINGNRVSLAALKGKKVFINFWSTFCGPCIAEMPEIEGIYQENKEKSDIVILSIDLGQSQETAKKFIDKKKYNFTVIADPERIAGDKFGVDTLPTSIFIDSQGYIASKKLGDMDKDEMYKYLNSLN